MSEEELTTRTWVSSVPKRMKVSIKRRQTPSSIFTGSSLITQLMQHDNQGLSEQEILDAVHDDPLFYSGINLIASQIASTDIWPVVDGEKDRSHEVAEKLNRPNQFHDRFSFLWLVTASLLATGTAYIYHLNDQDLLPVPATHITHQGGLSYHVRLWGNTQRKATLHEDLVKLTLPDLRNPYISGSGYGAALGDELDIAAAARKHESSTLHQNARPDTVINVAGAGEQELKQTKESWDRSHQGPDQSGKIAWINGDKLDIQTLQTSFSDLGFIDLRQFSADHIRRTLGIPPELLGKSDNANRATIDAAFYVFAKTVLRPRIKQITSAFNKKIIPLITSDNVVLKHEDVVPENKEFKLQVMKEFPQAFSVNEARKVAGLPEVEDGDQPLDGQLELQETKEDQEVSENEDRTTRLTDELEGTVLNGTPESFVINDLYRGLKDA